MDTNDVMTGRVEANTAKFFASLQEHIDALNNLPNLVAELRARYSQRGAHDRYRGEMPDLYSRIGCTLSCAGGTQGGVRIDHPVFTMCIQLDLSNCGLAAVHYVRPRPLHAIVHSIIGRAPVGNVTMEFRQRYNDKLTTAVYNGAYALLYAGYIPTASKALMSTSLWGRRSGFRMSAPLGDTTYQFMQHVKEHYPTHYIEMPYMFLNLNSNNPILEAIVTTNPVHEAFVTGADLDRLRSTLRTHPLMDFIGD